MATVTDHQAGHILTAYDPVNPEVTIRTPDAEGVPTVYQIEVPEGPKTTLNFQLGDPANVGVNGLTVEALLAVVIDQLRARQEASPQDATRRAFVAARETLYWMQESNRPRECTPPVQPISGL